MASTTSQENANIHEALICLADLSNFTAFITDTREEEGGYVTAEILKGMLGSNKIGFELAEIEGDALFFYLPGRPVVTVGTLLQQCGIFYSEFRKIVTLLSEKPLSRSGLKGIEKLGLKIILHFGPVSMLSIADRFKPMGQTVVEAHCLLKNSVALQEYLLVTQAAADACGQRLKDPGGVQVFDGADVYDHLGEIKYSYFGLEWLTTKIPAG